MVRIRRQWRTFGVAVIFMVLGFTLGYMFRMGGESHDPLTKPDSMLFSGISGLQKGSSASSEAARRMIEGRTLFTVCGHWEPLNLGDFQGSSPDKLKEKFPSHQGWHIEDTGEKIVVTKDINALCPEDEGKRHLGCFGDYVAVIKGPPGVNGGIIEVTEIKVSNLPPSFRREAQQGTLDFPSAQNLLEALDSLDEYEE